MRTVDPHIPTRLYYVDYATGFEIAATIVQ